MRLKKLLLLLLLGVLIFSAVPIVSAAPKPDVWSAISALQATVADLQNQTAALWTNATQQQSAIRAEVGARTADDQALWTNASEQQAAIQAETRTREEMDANLQSQINNIQPGSTVHIGYPDETAPDGGPWRPDVVYYADTDGFVIATAQGTDEYLGRIGVVTWSDVKYVVEYNDDRPAGAICMPVRKGNAWYFTVFDIIGNPDYWVYWIPLETD